MARTVGLIISKPQQEPQAGVFICPVCGKEYKSESALTKHISEKHSDFTTSKED